MIELKTSELAKLFRVSDNTIRYYTNNGILNVDRYDNNYRKFSIKDFVRCLGVMELRQAGVSLKNIDKYVKNSGFESLDQVLRETEEDLVKKENELKRKRLFLKNILKMHGLLRQKGNCIEVEKSPFWYALPIPDNIFEIMDNYYLIKEFCDGTCLLSSQVELSSFLKGELKYVKGGYLYLADRAVKDKNDGSYELRSRESLHCVHVGSNDELKVTYARIHSFMNEQKLVPDDPILEVFMFANDWGCVYDIWVPLKQG